MSDHALPQGATVSKKLLPAVMLSQAHPELGVAGVAVMGHVVRHPQGRVSTHDGYPRGDTLSPSTVVTVSHPIVIHLLPGV